MLVVHQFTTEPHTCAYLPDRPATLEYMYTPRLSAKEYEELMNRGYRKFGAAVFRPVCAGCDECRPIRIPVERFRPDRSQRRASQRNEHLEVRTARPSVDAGRLALYHRYHDAQAERKGWPPKEHGLEEYSLSFVHNPVPSVEISLWDAGRLAAVVLTDVTPNVVSGVYHYYDPDLAPQSIGTYCMLQTIELARSLRKPWAYFGFYVAGCASMAYKARFQPCEILGADGTWREHLGRD